MSYKVGQVLFVVLFKEPNVYPMQVVEEITKKTLDGEVTTYALRAGADPNKVLSMSDIDGEIFDSAESAKATLLQRVSQSINNRVDKAIEKAREWYPTGFEHASDDPLTLLKKSTTNQERSVAKKKPVQGPKPETAALAAELAAESEASMIELPDGSKARIKSVKLPSSLQG